MELYEKKCPSSASRRVIPVYSGRCPPTGNADLSFVMSGIADWAGSAYH